MLFGVVLASKSLHDLGGQNQYAHVMTQRILNKVIEIKLSVDGM
jgi:hypothetical protein